MRSTTMAPAARKVRPSNKAIEASVAAGTAAMQMKNAAAATIAEINKAAEAADKDDEIEAAAHDKEVEAADKADKKAKAAKEPKAAKAPKAKKAPKVRALSSFGVSIELLCKNPTLTYKELVKEVADKQGLTTLSAIRTAHSQANKIFSLLRVNKLME